jgi:hypothetical protein
MIAPPLGPQAPRPRRAARSAGLACLTVGLPADTEKNAEPFVIVAGARDAAMSTVVCPSGSGGWSRTAHPVHPTGGASS